MATATLSEILVKQPFRPTARLLQLLGDELIASPRLAVFEMVKNAYDADASEVSIVLDIAADPAASITVTDDGTGMTLDTLQHVWLVPGNSHRQQQRNESRRTPVHHRLPIGEKGIGRFAAHKLGNRIEVVTRSRNEDEYIVAIDWDDLIGNEYLDEALVSITGQEPQVFQHGATGTRIRVNGLRHHWTRGEVRRLHRQITSLCSPFQSPESFRVNLAIPGREEWTGNLPDLEHIMSQAFWKFEFEVRADAFDWKYDFRQLPGLKLQGNHEERKGDILKLPRRQEPNGDEDLVVKPETLQGIGPISGVFHVYDQEQPILRRLNISQSITDYLKESGGIRIYRDGIRIYNYGEPGNDWLELDLRRVNVPARRISNNNILGAIHLDLKESTGLIEKTNREGFQESAAANTLKRIILGVLETFEGQRIKDKDRIRRVTGNTKDSQPAAGGMERLIDEVNKDLDKLSVNTSPIKAHLRRIRDYYNEMESTLLSAGMSGLNLAVVFHEVERGVQTLHQAVIQNADRSSLEEQTRNLSETLSSFAALLRKDSRKRHSARELVTAACRINKLRFDYHQVKLTCPFLESNEDGFYSDFTFNLTLGSLSNLIDNALYWLRIRWPEKPENRDDSQRRLYIGLSRSFAAGPAVVVADNGAGFDYSTPDQLVRPFFTHKPDGMGLGLFYTSLSMELQHGQLVFPQPGEVDLPKDFDGAIVAMLFKEAT